MAKKKIYNIPYILTLRACRCSNGIYNEFIVKRQFDNLFHLKYYMEHYKDRYGETFDIIEVISKKRMV